MLVFTFANQSGLDMLETTLVGLQDITLEVLDDQVRKNLCAELPGVMEQGFACIPGSLCVYRPVSYDKPLAWRGRCSLTIAACTTSASCLSTGRLVLHLVDIGRFKRGRTR
ncbi:hypothetical protein PVAP13_7NG296600 [Panicum virgatum]|uniref:MEKHLA domain-containing protein n=1 Tax=Panicum virgatum TaxID=38727 RepID=A0A8T0QD55_PANVG|nr:hypothetical protein PVAP13_7NG296600 [Panicum virgatum]